MEFTPKKYDWVDFGRSIAILLVIMVHTGQVFSKSYFLKHLTGRGDMGVQLFFILSAFTLFSSYSKRYNFDGLKRNSYFFIRRYFRITPLYYFFAIYYTLFEIYIKGNSVVYWKVIISIFYLNGIVLPAINYIPPGGWSIGTEMLFYLLIPFLFVKTKSVSQAIKLLVITVIISNIFNIVDKYFIENYTKLFYEDLRGNELFMWLPNQLPIFCLGILLYFILEKYSFNKLTKNLSLISSIILFILFSQKNFPYFKYPYYFFQTEYVFSFVFCLFIIGIYNCKFIDKISCLFLSIGKYSFAMYLSHFTFLYIFNYILTTKLHIEKSDFIFIVSYTIIVSITFLASSFLHKYEKLGIEYGNKLIERNKLKNSIRI
jgi:peptidoglycan/LPS O-acetylase OafA/YrhL